MIPLFCNLMFVAKSMRSLIIGPIRGSGIVKELGGRGVRLEGVSWVVFLESGELTGLKKGCHPMCRG
jgi:hypothetical protein